MSRRALSVLGVGQCINWGILYYAFAVLLLPVARDLAVSEWVVTGAFSLGLLLSAGCAPRIGRWADNGHGGTALQWGGFSSAALLVFWALMPNLVTLYVTWAALGVCMAATLYEPAFAVISRAHADHRQRLRAIATITLFGGVASTVALPTTAWLIARLGWRPSVLVLAAVLALSTYATRVLALPGLVDTISTANAVNRPADLHPRPHFGLTTLVFALGSLGSAALMSNLVPALGERNVSPALAASLGGLLGVMQVPGRALMMQGALSASPRRLVILCLSLQGGGLLAVATAPSPALIGVSIALFAIGSGLTTLVRPHLVHTSYGMAQAGLLNGELARAQQLARAAGPIAAAFLAARSSYSLVFIGLSAAFAVTSFAWMSTVRPPR